MAEERLEAVRAFYEDWNRRDFDAALRFAHPDFVLRATPALGSLQMRGHEEAKRFWSQFFDGWEELTVSPVDEPFASGDSVVVELQWWGRGRGGIEVNQRVVDVWTFEGDVAVRLDGFETKTAALRAIEPGADG